MKLNWKKTVMIMLVMMLACQISGCNKKGSADSAATPAIETPALETTTVPEATSGEAVSTKVPSGMEEKDEENSGWTIYTGKGFQISYPDTWESQDLSQYGFGASPKDLEDDDYAENVLIVTQNLSGYDKMNLEKFKEITLSQFDNTDAFEKISCEETTLGGKKAYKLILKSSTEEVDFKSVQVFTVVGKTGYIFGFSGDKKGFEQYRKDADAMLKTFRFVETKEDDTAATEVPEMTGEE